MNAAQPNLRELCEAADFIDSGFQSFHEQVGDLPPHMELEAAFFAGAALAFKLLDHFRAGEYPAAQLEFIEGMIATEITDYMRKHGLKLEWQPHVPRGLRQ